MSSPGPLTLLVFFSCSVGLSMESPQQQPIIDARRRRWSRKCGCRAGRGCRRRARGLCQNCRRRQHNAPKVQPEHSRRLDQALDCDKSVTVCLACHSSVTTARSAFVDFVTFLSFCWQSTYISSEIVTSISSEADGDVCCTDTVNTHENIKSWWYF